MSLIFGFDSSTLSTFDSAYWASQPLPVQALQPMDASQSTRTALAYQLAGHGYFIDVPIMVWGWDPYMTMYQRQIDGYITYPDALNSQTRPVSTNPNDYPAVPVPTPPTGQLVGPQIGMSPYYFVTEAAVNANLPAGYRTEQDDHTFVLQYIQQITLTGQSQTIGRWLLAS